MHSYKPYFNTTPFYVCEWIRREESSVNIHLVTDHNQLIMLPNIKDCSNTYFLTFLFICAPVDFILFLFLTLL